MLPAPMPDRYIAEMMMDRIAACKTYEGDKYTDGSPLAYFKKGHDPAPMHEYTRTQLEMLLGMLAEKGEAETCRYIRNVFLRKNRKV